MEKLEQLINLVNKEIFENKAFPGANLVIVTDENKTFLSQGNKSLYTVDDDNNLVDHVEKNSLETIYDMASLSKVVSTTSCVLKLIDMGLLRIASYVYKILPRFKHQNITIWHLLTHTSGLPEGVSGLMNMKTSDDVMDFIYNVDLTFEPGTKIKYSDINFILIGKIVEALSGKSLDEFAKENIFDPLEMYNTGYNPVNKNKCAPTEHRNDPLYKGMVQGFVHDETALLLGGVAGHAGLFSTVNDISNFIEMILNDGMFKGKKILSKAAIDLILEPQVQEAPGVLLHGTIRSIGWLVGGFGGPNGDLTNPRLTIHHTGFTGTSLWIDKSNRVGFCMLTNRVHPTRNNPKHIDARAKISNFIMANLEDFK